MNGKSLSTNIVYNPMTIRSFITRVAWLTAKLSQLDCVNNQAKNPIQGAEGIGLGWNGFREEEEPE